MHCTVAITEVLLHLIYGGRTIPREAIANLLLKRTLCVTPGLGSVVRVFLCHRYWGESVKESIHVRRT